MAKTGWTMGARVMIMCSTVTAAVVIGTSHVTTTTDNVTTEASYSEWTPLRYFLVINCIACVYSALPIFIPSESLQWKLVAILDLIITTLMATAGASCAVVVHIMKNGVPQVGSDPYDHYFPIVTSHVIGALSVSCIGILLQFVLCIYSYSCVLNPLLLPQ